MACAFQNKSQFWINGVSKREKDVKELVAQMGIQLENLCQFLPQEKVQSFANYAGRYYPSRSVVCGKMAGGLERAVAVFPPSMIDFSLATAEPVLAC